MGIKKMKMFLVFKFFFVLLFASKFVKSEIIGWEFFQHGGKIDIFSSNTFNLTHPKGLLGNVVLKSLNSYTIKGGCKLVWNTSFKILDVVDPSGTKTYGEAETRQRILVVYNESLNSVLPFDFGFFEAVTGDPTGGNRLWVW